MDALYRGYPPGGFSKTNGAGKKHAPTHSCLRGREMNLSEECALVDFSLMKGRLWWRMSSLGYLSAGNLRSVVNRKGRDDAALGLGHRGQGTGDGHPEV